MNFRLVDGYTKRVEIVEENIAYIHCFWTKLKVSRAIAERMVPEETDYKPAKGYPRVRKWIDENTQGRWASHIHLFYFENPKDATHFLLRWS